MLVCTSTGPNSVYYRVTEDIDVRNGAMKHENCPVQPRRVNRESQWSGYDSVEISKLIVSKYCDERTLPCMPIKHALSFSYPGPLRIVSSMTKSLYALAYYGIAINDDSDRHFPLKQSLEIKPGSPSWMELTPVLDLTLNKITLAHSTLNDTCLLDIMKEYLEPHSHDRYLPAVPVELIANLQMMGCPYSQLSWTGRKLESPAAEGPVFTIVERVCNLMNELYKGRLINYNGYECKVDFVAKRQEQFKLTVHGYTIVVVPDITVYALLLDPSVIELVAELPMITFEAKSPGCAISEGAKCTLDSAAERYQREHRDETLYNQLNYELASHPWVYRIKRTYHDSMRNAETNFALTLRQGVTQAVVAGTSLFGLVDGVSLTIFEITNSGPIVDHVINMTCNVHHSDVEQKNPGVLLLRALLNKFCYTYCGKSIKTPFTGEGTSIPRGHNSNHNRIYFQSDIQLREEGLKKVYTYYVGELLRQNVSKALEINGAVEKTWNDFRIGRTLQQFDKMGLVAEAGVRAKVYKLRSLTTSDISHMRVLKLLEPTCGGLELFQNEIKAYKRLQGTAAAPFIPQLYSFGVIHNADHDEKPMWMLFTELEFIQGKDVPFGSRQEEIKTADRLFRACGVQHTDLFPRNMLFDCVNKQLKIFDFGQAIVQ